MRNAEQLVRFAARQAEKLFRRLGEVHAMYHYVRADGTQSLLLPPPWESGRDKDTAVAFARTVFAQENVVAYVFITEIWELSRADMSRDEARKRIDEEYGGTLENAPDRTEHVMMMGEDETGMVYGKMQIHRPEGRKPYLDALKIDRPPDMEGRMVGLLPLRGTKQ
jgi:hypothetical protein